MSSITKSTYGKSRVRLARVSRSATRNELIEWTIRISFEGSYESAYRDGDNTAVLPTDTMKNTVYSRARNFQGTSAEDFARELVEHFLHHNPEPDAIAVEITEKPWEHLALRGVPDPYTFQQARNGLYIATVRGNRQKLETRSGVAGLAILKTARSGFEGFRKDKLTTLPETADRLLGTSLSADWGYVETAADFPHIRREVHNSLLSKFAEHESRSVQHTLFAMSEAVLSAVPAVRDIRLTMPNIHCLLVDLSRFGQDNPNQIFVPIDEPHGFIEAHVTRDM